MMSFFRLIRWKNILIILLTEAIIKYALMDYFFSITELNYRMSDKVFFILALSSIFIAAGGYIINDINDIDIDTNGKRDRPLATKKIKLSTAKILLYIFNGVGIILSIYVAFIIKNPSLATVQLLVMALLYGYSTLYKCSKLIGNIIVSLTTAMVPFLIWIYTIYDVLAQGFMFSYDLRWMHLSVVFFIAFAFLSNMIRELLKDREDAKADLTYGCNTWSASVSLKSFKIMTFTFIVLLVSLLFFFQYYFPISLYFRIYLSIVHFAILIFIVPWLYKSKEVKDFARLSTAIKIIMLLGLISPLILWV